MMFTKEICPPNIVCACIDFTNCFFNLGNTLGTRHNDDACKLIQLVCNPGVHGAN
jgi:hypothetical protein